MADVSWSHRLDNAAINRLLTSPQGGAVRDLLRRGLLVETQAKRNLAGQDGPRRIDTGRLRSSINTQVVTRAGVPTVLVGTNVWYARLVHDGTGLYGPKHAMIKPKRHKFLRFKPKGQRRYVYARQVKGMRPNKFLLNALRAAKG